MVAQQKQTQEYFKKVADDWQAKAIKIEGEYNVVDARNSAVLAVLDEMPEAKTLLDVGCGTGQLVIAAAERGLSAEGIDFAEPMVQVCEKNKQDANVQATFRCASFFDMVWPDEQFDIVSAQGFIEYISPEQMEVFFERCAKILKPGGALVVGSRNRLFNVVSMNAFTQMEIDLNVLVPLVEEAIELQTSPSLDDAFQRLNRFGRILIQPDKHPITGIAVDVRYQYNPAELIWRLRKSGFIPKNLFPVHFHGLPGSLMKAYSNVHNQLAGLMGETAKREHRLVPFSSTFLLDVRKA